MFENLRRILFGSQSNSNQNGNYGFSPRSRNSYRCLYNLVPFEQARNMIETQNVYLIDVRTKNEYDFMHIKNAVNIPVDDIKSRVDEIPSDKDLMVYCASGSRSKSAICILNSLGYNNIYIWEYGALATFPYRELIEYGEKR